MQDQTDTAAAQFAMNTARVRAEILVAIVAAVIAAFGAVLAGAEAAQATRKWLADTGIQPTDMAKTKMQQAVHASRAATHAAVDAWQHNGEVVSPV